ncbi:dihydrodipicolinate synthase family protein [Sphingobium subterraneum]|uniref:4-hydroxy-tetrahydrodipicolinate synthase n=1 Tax=Sphingobium subterraneum TaxID=627688 RepID=A0A841J4F7_9SPHN|nr:dihydrodipicolinate synthase family protein [Sphingobium subterraneum]MBB6123408.1 4-hydroxy-tetrahydrodipicolinate synthase [Sphingobium subterraneum]
MTRLDRSTLHGFVPAVVTPFAADGSIVDADFKTLVERLIACGATGICVAGDNGESWNLSIDERAHLTRLAVEAAAGRVPIITGVSAPSAQQTIAYAKAADAAGAAAVLAMPQTYVIKATREELVARFSRLSDATDIPVILYNSPRRTQIELSLADIDAIMGCVPVIGIKESHRDFFHLTHLIEQFAERMAIMVGPSHYILPGIALGAAGFIATGPELLGAKAGEITAIARQAPSAESAHLHFQLTALYELLMGTGTWPSSFKAALNLLGWPAGIPRDPVLPIAGPALQAIEKRLGELGLR